MYIMFLQSVPYGLEARGASKSTWFLVEELLKLGHLCMVAAPTLSLPVSNQWIQCQGEIKNSHVLNTSDHDVKICQLGPVKALICKNPAKLATIVRDQIREFTPDWVLVSSEYPQQMFLLNAALQEIPERVIYLAHATQLLPFGPKSFAPSTMAADMLHKVAGIITVSHYLKEYIQHWAALDSVVLPFPVFSKPPYPQLGFYDRGGIMLINPCAYKGISIFISLARAFPEVPFVAVPTWGTTSADRQMLQTLNNVQIIEPMDDIDQLYTQARILLVPSLWEEAFGYVAIEAMLRGIPVLASNIGGLPESKLGVDYILPVTPIEHYENRFDEQKNPVPIIPSQDLQPWFDALHRLLSDQEHYEQLSAISRQTAQEFVARIRATAYEGFMEELSKKTSRPTLDEAQVSKSTASVNRTNLAELSPEKRALIASRLKNKQ